MSYRCVILMLAGLFCCGPAGAAEPASRPVTVFAAASLTNVLDELGREFTRTTGVPVRFSFASSAILARQIEAGARADVFLPADQEWMEYLERRSLIQTSSRRDVAGNRLVLIAPRASGLQLVIEPGFPLVAALGKGRLATGDPDSVPAGRYARAALTSLGVWDDVADRLVRADDVRHALMFVARGEAPLGIVYATDARVDGHVRIVGTFPADSHLPITYPVALTRRAGPDAERFVQFVLGDAGRAAFQRAGFMTVP
jgi:molybdate transport system substrate-binding protein